MCFFFSSRRRHTRYWRDWSSDVCSSDLKVVVIDNLVTGHVDAVDERAELLLGDLRDEEFLQHAFEKHSIDGVIDFAAFSLVGESVGEPLKYFENNFYGTLCLLKAMQKYKVNNIVFSSTAATYGEPANIPILEK